MKNKQTPQEMSDASIPSLRVKLLLRGQSPRNVILWLMGIALFLQLLIPLGQAGTRKVVARRGSSKVSQGDISSLIGSGESSAGHGSVLPQQAQGPVYSEIPGPAHDEDEESVEPTIPVPQGKAWNTIPSPAVRATEAPATTKLQTPNFEPQAPNDVVTQITHDITPSEVSATQRSAIHEPSVGNAGNTLFMSANWYAARSSDGGNTFSYVNPYTTFPSVNGGFCCDQIVNYARNQDMTLWALQYVKDASSGTLRIARAVGSTDVLNNSWIYYDFNPQMFGFASGNWMDFPNLSLGSTFLYATSNVFRTSDNGFTGSVIWRIPLSQLAAGGSISFSYFTRTDVGGLRCTEGAATTMYWASFANTSTMRIFRWDDSSGSIFWDNVALNPFTYLNRDGVSMTPDGRNWVARADSRVLGASVTGGVIALIWGAKQDATFPQPYTVAARFSQSNRALLTQQQIWNPEFAWLYMNASVNSAGNQAGLIAYGGGALYPNSAFWINDDVQSGFAPLNNYVVASSTAGPAGNAWGDFLTTRTHKDFPNSWVATTYYMTAGGGNSNAVGRYMWIGRQRDLPPACTPSSISFGGTINGTLIVTDCRSPARGTQYYADQYSFSATAGQRITTTLSSSAFDTYLYLRGTTGSVIADDDDGGGGTNSRIPAGSGFFTVPTTGTYTIEATSFDQLSTGSYTLNLALAVSRTLTVASSNPGSGVSITVSPNDNNGQGNGVTQFTRVYDDAANAVLTAPATAGGNNFQKWQRDSADFSFNQTATVTMNANHTMTAVYVTQPSPNRTLTVASSNPSSGVTITVSPNDNNSQGDGVTQFNRVYNNNTVVSLTAPSSATGNNFSKWQRDGADFSFSQTTNVTMDANHTMTAFYVTPAGSTTGLYDPVGGAFFFKFSNSSGPSDYAFTFGPANQGWTPVIGDWDGNGVDTIGLYYPANGAFFIRNSNTSGIADIYITYGPAGQGWLPVIGDWDGNGTDTLGLYNPGNGSFYLRNSNTVGFADLTFPFGPIGQGWIPIVGDWNGDGGDTVGLYNPATGAVQLRNSNTSGAADASFTFTGAGPTWKLIVGDWDGNETSTLGLYNPATGAFLLRNSNTTGGADISITWEGGNYVPLAGKWQ